jgi:hypothetical protein
MALEDVFPEGEREIKENGIIMQRGDVKWQRECRQALLWRKTFPGGLAKKSIDECFSSHPTML